MKIKFIIITLLSLCGSVLAQESNIKKIDYAHIIIDVPEKYVANSEYEIKSSLFSAQWLYLTKEMFEQNVQSQIIKQFEAQIEGEEVGTIDFISSGGKFTGKKYKLNNESILKYKVLAYGVVNNQPLILNLSFDKEPKSDSKFDQLIQKFITF